MLDCADEHTLLLALQPGQLSCPRRQEETLVLAVLEDAVGMSQHYAVAVEPSTAPAPPLGPTRVAAFP